MIIDITHGCQKVAFYYAKKRLLKTTISAIIIIKKLDITELYNILKYCVFQLIIYIYVV